MNQISTLDELMDQNTLDIKHKNVYIPKCLGGFTNLNLLGSGAFSVVLSAEHLLDRNTYALKCIPLPDNKEIIKDKSREIILLSRLTHPNIIRYFNSWIEYIPNALPKCITNHITNHMETPTEHKNTFILIQMEKIDFTLKSYIQSRDTISIPIQSIIIQIIDGLEYLHQQKIVHCDIKPDNISLKYENNNWIVKIMDFGIAGIVNIPNINYKYYGTDLYLAPEFDSEDYKPLIESDIYSFGIVLFELIHQFHTESEKIDNVLKWKKGTYTTKNKLLDNMIHYNPEERTSLNSLREYIKHNYI